MVTYRLLGLQKACISVNALNAIFDITVLFYFLFSKRWNPIGAQREKETETSAKQPLFFRF